jgi:prepilin-type N-terminal cleavage/methylation domain-containing protein
MINGNEFRNAIRGQKGFTLVEVIVVAIIVAALAAVASPLYNNYVTTSRNNAAANAAGSVASFLGACASQVGTATGAPAALVLGTAVNGPYTVTCTYGTPALTTNIAVPVGISITVAGTSLAPVTSPGTVTATSGAGGTGQVYSF